MTQSLSKDIIHFFHKQNFVIVSTLDAEGHIHCAAKGIAAIEDTGHVYLVDLYLTNTFANIKRNPHISITAIDEHAFSGYTLKGKAKIIEKAYIDENMVKAWEEKVIHRISRRVISSIQKEKKGIHHPEAKLPSPQYVIDMEVEAIVNLTPAYLRNPVE
jgi:general stress protein 26